MVLVTINAFTVGPRRHRITDISPPDQRYHLPTSRPGYLVCLQGTLMDIPRSKILFQQNSKRFEAVLELRKDVPNIHRYQSISSARGASSTSVFGSIHSAFFSSPLSTSLYALYVPISPICRLSSRASIWASRCLSARWTDWAPASRSRFFSRPDVLSPFSRGKWWCWCVAWPFMGRVG